MRPAIKLGTFKPGSKQPDPIGKIDGIGFDNCKGSAGSAFAVSIDRLPWAINAHSYNAATGTTTGTIADVHIVMSGRTGTATLGDTRPAMPLTPGFSYTNRAGRLKVAAPGDAHWWVVSGCHGSISNGEPGSFSFGGGFAITPRQKITSP